MFEPDSDAQDESIFYTKSYAVSQQKGIYLLLPLATLQIK